ncbi:hypothetical protein CIT37_10760 [Bradyrhizobium ottawaense]|uniref:Uncharacterized protein n=1 Tax=Bradyrhizobium ottawaense TaxID=931866 RepID=A0A2U8P4J7_9BRAD|nr:hypothetical protein [Bradyrhizobium ottawaense]AWL92639.1 hypothetical protein CIT37_10760 [Bradyrhizobium ottawaense]
MTSTETTVPSAREPEPVKDLFDILSIGATLWGFVALCVWAESEGMTALGLPDTPRISLAGVSAIALFIYAGERLKKDQRVQRFVEQIRYVVILAAAVLLGAYLHANHKDDSYESALRDGAVLACSKMAACKTAATEYANTR